MFEEPRKETGIFDFEDEFRQKKKKSWQVYKMLSSILKKYKIIVEKEMATHSSNLVWEIPWTEEPGGLQSVGSQRVRHDLVTK